MAATRHRSLPVSVVIFGGGAAGLWLLDELTRRRTSALLLEANRLGQGQTVASQGILHGGLKYTLGGLLTKSASHIRDMPGVWRDCLAGRRAPELIGTPVRSECCYLWRTDTVSSRLGMIGAKLGLRVAPKSLAREERPEILADCPGSVARLDEQVISPAGLIANLAARNRERILKIDAQTGVEFHVTSPGHIESMDLRSPAHQKISLHPETVVFTAGAGNALLRANAGLSTEAMQRRPLHMVMLRGAGTDDNPSYRLPELNGHCVDGRKTRVTITSDVDSAGRTVWQVGGQIAEDGVAMEPHDLIQRARAELEAVIPGIDLSGVEWSTHRVDRAEARMKGNRRPETFHFQSEGNTVTAWPTKLVLAPRLAEELADLLPGAPDADGDVVSAIADWPKPSVALPPWETATDWRKLDEPPIRSADAA